LIPDKPKIEYFLNYLEFEKSIIVGNIHFKDDRHETQVQFVNNFIEWYERVLANRIPLFYNEEFDMLTSFMFLPNNGNLCYCRIGNNSIFCVIFGLKETQNLSD
jgi:hypothetical protein